MTASAPGALIGSGRNADVYDIGGGRVLRRYRDERDLRRVAAEAQVMAHARSGGVPVPEVFEVSDADIVMARVTGPTMLDVLGRRPWTVGAQARLLARLHGLVHQIPAAGLAGLGLRPASPSATGDLGDGDVLVHNDLHPQNVIMAAGGPVLIDWESARIGPPIADIAMTWAIIKFSEIPATSLRGGAARGVQALLTRSFLRAAGPLDEAWRLAIARQRLADRNLLPAEAARLRKLLPRDPAG
jgi:aminoglycoside phosphotransferase (APT) family kinase protein